MKFLIFTFLFFSMLTHATLIPTSSEPANHFSCYKQMKPIIEKWKSKEKWSVKLSKGPAYLFTTPTNRLSQWIILEKKEKSESLVKMSPSNRVEISFSSNCEKKMSIVEVKNFSQKNEFNDVELGKLLQKNNKGMIVFWSPGMNHSLTMIKNAKEISEKNKIHLTIILDPYADKKNANSYLKKKGLTNIALKKNNSFELMMRNTLIHYPSMIFYKDGLIASPVLPGLVGPEQMSLIAQKYIESTK